MAAIKTHVYRDSIVDGCLTINAEDRIIQKITIASDHEWNLMDMLTVFIKCNDSLLTRASKQLNYYLDATWYICTDQSEEWCRTNMSTILVPFCILPMDQDCDHSENEIQLEFSSGITCDVTVTLYLV